MGFGLRAESFPPVVSSCISHYIHHRLCSFLLHWLCNLRYVRSICCGFLVTYVSRRIWKLPAVWTLCLDASGIVSLPYPVSIMFLHLLAPVVVADLESTL